jgi:hypothetical protein
MISIRLDGARQTAVRVDRIDERMRARLNAAIHRLTPRVKDRMVAAEPDRSGRLRSEARESYSDRDGIVAGRVIAAPRRDAVKAAALEYGAHRNTPVRAYNRANGDMVSAYTRRVNIQPHRFVRGTLEAMQAEIDAELQRAVEETIDEANA